jgi:hypothetical protein
VLTGAVAGLLIKEFCRREEPTIFDVRVGFVRVCLDEVRKFEVAKVVAVEVAMTLKVLGYRAVTGKRGEFIAIAKIFSSEVVVLEKVEILDQRDRRQWTT